MRLTTVYFTPAQLPTVYLLSATANSAGQKIGLENPAVKYRAANRGCEILTGLNDLGVPSLLNATFALSIVGRRKRLLVW